MRQKPSLSKTTQSVSEAVTGYRQSIDELLSVEDCCKELPTDLS